ncbi:TetR/AcrR family transcriptional regulator [Pseudactinotalea sp. HY158]|uniref:TetR/AcrR family transcriptional regulator n=1 Tax=Pseudactinotalea sp. HY158 TaxID=2654547 RepID=UPI00129CDDC3|nr:TetR/AcrR family transcriptional regulator [Pseudactinotalea sp. HY158]QGH70154.1 TetR family transcriptional regulator [Pseudactinotalea sp. HY158]
MPSPAPRRPNNRPNHRPVGRATDRASGRPTDRPTRRQEAAAASRAETRRRLLRAAGAEFADRGYHAATVARIADRAGVTVQTLYLAWGSKRALLRAHLDAALSGDAGTDYSEQLPRLISQSFGGTESDARAVVERIARFYVGLAGRAALGWRLYRDAAATDAEVAADWRALQDLRRRTVADLVGRIPAAELRADLTPEAAADTAWAIASPETYELLVTTAGYDLAAYEHWVGRTLAAALLARPAPPGPDRPQPREGHDT